ncbi:hypothetical protein H4219_002411 [Mycoemilia scoparia]|uniref:Uncharacterized protein n=1 Tax=Mycoemilia scoparia TaxID=417184 RepID=A0A9W8A5P5_9FUNG|nr:hypothetical protein H4219_002411 [Mycoemilia scoparia]
MKRALSSDEGSELRPQKLSRDDIEPYELWQLQGKISSLGWELAKKELARVSATCRSEQTDASVKNLAIRIGGRMCVHPNADSRTLVKTLVGILPVSTVNQRYQIYHQLAKIHKMKGIDNVLREFPDEVQMLESNILKDTNNSNSNLRCICIVAYTHLFLSGLLGKSQISVSIDKEVTEKDSKNKLVEILSRYLNDPEFKIRATSLRVLLDLYYAGHHLDVQLYDVCVLATKDEHYQVRLCAMELLSAISQLYPEQPVSIQKNYTMEHIRLLDDAFVKICDMINDTSVIVRQRACAVLGRYYNVGMKFLLQTLSKQVMSNLKRYAPKGRREANKPGSKSKGKGGKGSSIPTPSGDADVELESIRLLDSGAAGAFVHGLEDEYQEVRDAAIESITELSIRSSEFGEKTVDFLVDMFNDSSDIVRLNSLKALNKIGSQIPIQFNDEQLSIALSAMEDANPVIRESVHSIFKVSRMDSVKTLTKLVESLHGNIDKYPEDKTSIWETFKSIGELHSNIISSDFVCSLLNLSTQFLNREPSLEDSKYTANLIMIMNIDIDKRKKLQEVLPKFVYGHLPFFREMLPHCFPKDLSESVPGEHEFVLKMLKRPGQPFSIDNGGSLTTERSTTKGALAKIQSIIETVVSNFGSQDSIDSIGTKLKNVESQIGSMSISRKPESDNLNIMKDYLDVLLRLDNIVRLYDQFSDSAYLLQQNALVMEACYSIQCKYLGLSPNIYASLLYCRLFCNIIWLLVEIRSHSISISNLIGDFGAVLFELILQRIEKCKSFIESNLELPTPLKLLADQITDIKAQSISAQKSRSDEPHTKNNVITSRDLLDTLQTFIKSFVPIPLQFDGIYRIVSAQLRIPETKYAIEFNYKFPFTIHTVGKIKWFDVRSKLGVEASEEDLTPLSPYEYNISKDISVMLQLSSGINETIKFDLVVYYMPDQFQIDSQVLSGNLTRDTFSIADFEADSDQWLSYKVTDRSLELNAKAINPRPEPRKTF